MAQVAGGGSKAAVMADFNPKETTLREVITNYAEASRAKGSKLTGFEDKLFKSKALQTYLDNPVAELFDGHWGDADNPLIKLLNSVGEKSRGGYYSAIASIESNVFRQFSRLRFNEDYKPLTEGVARPEKGVKYTSKFGYNPERLGPFHANLVEFVKNNPDSKPVANALLFQLYTGFRPNAAGGLTPQNIQSPQIRGGPHGIFISGSQLGAKGSPINVPLTRRAMALLQSQELFNENRFGGQQFIFQKNVGNQIKPIDDKDITGLLKKMQKANLIPEGLKVDVSGITPKSSANLTAYDLRRLHATTLAYLQVPIEKAAMLTGRVVGSGGEQARYIGVSPGVFNPKGAAFDANKLTDYMYNEYSRVVPGGMEAAEKNKKFLSRNRDIFSPNQPIEFVKPDTDVFKGTYGKGTKLVQTVDPEFIEGDYKVIDDKPLLTMNDASDETKQWFQNAGGAIEDKTPKIEDKTTTKDKIIKTGKALKGPAKFAVAPVLYKLMKPGEVEAAEKRFESPDAGFIRKNIKELGLGSEAAELEGSIVAGAKAVDPGVELIYDVGRAVKETVAPEDSETALKEIQEYRKTDIRPKSNFKTLSDKMKERRKGFINQNQAGR